MRGRPAPAHAGGRSRRGGCRLSSTAHRSRSRGAGIDQCRGQLPNPVSDEEGQSVGSAPGEMAAAIIPDLHDEPIREPRAATRITDAEHKLRRPHVQLLALRAGGAATGRSGNEICPVGAHGIRRWRRGRTRPRTDGLRPGAARPRALSRRAVRGRRGSLPHLLLRRQPLLALVPGVHRACPLSEREPSTASGTEARLTARHGTPQASDSARPGRIDLCDE